MAAIDDGTVTEAVFRAIGTTCRLLVTHAETLVPATEFALRHLESLDEAASRFRADSEVMKLAAMAADKPATMMVSGTLADYLGAALTVSELTDGLVDPTVGAAVVASGYDADIDDIRATDARRGAGPAPVPGWRQVALSDAGVVHVPQGTLLDLGATAKAHAADTIAARLASRHPGGFLVNLGGDIAVSGVIPPQGWNIAIELADGQQPQVIRSDGAAVCTSSTQLRTWTGPDGSTRHHIVDPRTGATVAPVWASVTCAADSALVANAMSTASIVLGSQAPQWLRGKGISARLDAVDSTVTLVNGWPSPREGGA